MGKNVTSTTTTTFGNNPNPNQTTNRGAIAMIGIVCEPTSNGSTARRTQPTRSRAIATPVAATIDTPNPASVSTSVGTTFRNASSRNSQRDASTRLGAGRTNGLTPDARAYSSHARSTRTMTASGGPNRRTRVDSTVIPGRRC